MSNRPKRRKPRPDRPSAPTDGRIVIQSISDIEAMSPMDQVAFYEMLGSARQLGCQCLSPTIAWTDDGEAGLQMEHDPDCAVVAFGNVEGDPIVLDLANLPSDDQPGEPSSPA